MSKPIESPSLIEEIRERFLEQEAKKESSEILQGEALDPIALQQNLILELKELRQEAGDKTIAEFVDNLTTRLFENSLTLEQVRGIVRRIEVLEFLRSSERKKKYIDYQDPKEIKLKLTDSIKKNLLYDQDEDKLIQVDFLEFKNRLEHVFFRFVLTAHPVYPFSEELMLIQSQLITGMNEKGVPLTEHQKKILLQQILGISFKPEENLTIEREFEISMKALQNMRAVLFDFRKIALGVAKDAFPDQWIEINVQLLQLASWVCYDTDGRNDINQFQSFLAAYTAKYDELLFYKSTLEGLNDGQEERLEDKLEILKFQLKSEINLIQEELGLLEAGVKKNLANQSCLSPLDTELQRLKKERERTEQKHFSSVDKKQKAVGLIDRKIAKISSEIYVLEEEGVAQIAKFEERVSRKIEERILSADTIIQRLNDVINCCASFEKQNQSTDKTDKLKIELVALRSEVSSGLCNALIHMRTGALRFENAASLLLDKENKPIFTRGHSVELGKQTYSTHGNSELITDLITKLNQYKTFEAKKGQVTITEIQKMLELKEEICFAELDIDLKKIDSHEVTVIKFFATIVEMYRYIDAKTPIRFLISEFEHEFAYLTALFFAKFFEIDQKIEICPLIEFKKIVQEDGISILNRLLSNPHVQDYIRKQGRFYLQLGFSDGGRQTTQFSFSDAAEFLRIQVKDLLEKKGLHEVDFVCFPTGGESSARGRNLFSFRNTLEHFSPDLSRCTVDQTRDFQTTIEQTFQGLDGQFWFLQPEMAQNVLFQALDFAIQTPDLCDPYYREPSHESQNQELNSSHDFVDFLHAWHTKVPETCYRLLKEKGHALMLDLFQFIDPDEKRGSRPVLRERDRHNADEKSLDAEKKRAINYSAIFDNLNYKVQLLAGVGTFLNQMNSQQRKQFYVLYKSSQRFKREIDNILRAYSMVDIAILGEYVKSKMPETYINSAQVANTSEMSDRLLHAANKIQKYSNERILVEVQKNLQALKDDLEGGKYFLDKLLSENQDVSIQEEHKADLTLLHCLRIAVKREIMRRSADLPRFNQKGTYGYEATMNLFYEGNIMEAISIFKIAFPANIHNQTEKKGIQIIENRPVNYAYYHQNIFDPILRLNDLFVKITSAVSLCEDGWG